MKMNARALLLGLFFLGLMGCATGSSRTLSSKETKVDGLLNLASASINEGDYISALEYLNQARDLDDSNPKEYYFYSLAYLGKKEVRLATDAARRAIHLDPKYSAAKNTLGKLLLDQGKYDESEKYLLEAANDLLNRESGLPKFNLGVLYFKTLKYAKSEKWLNLAIDERSSLSCLAQFYIGKIRLSQNDLTHAEKAFTASAKGNCSAMSEAHLAIGQTLAREKKYDQARSKFIEIQRLFPSSDAYDKAVEYLREIP
jgi:tetratricopeptide (TPR) repeat protein